MPTFPRGHHAFTIRLKNARELARQQRAAPTPAPTSTFAFPDPVDLRGIPAIGYGIGGTQPGTQPENAACR